jgi:diguanylate cyclase (GGDEF)-like protein
LIDRFRSGRAAPVAGAFVLSHLHLCLELSLTQSTKMPMESSEKARGLPAGLFRGLMISLKKYIDALPDEPGPECEPEDTSARPSLLHAYRSALREMGNSGLKACPNLGAELKQDLEMLEQCLSGKIDRDFIATVEKEVRQLLQTWGSGTGAYYRRKAAEVKELLIDMAHTADSFAARDYRYAEQIVNVTRSLESIATLEDLADVRASIRTSAANLKMSVERMTEEGRQAIAQLRDEVSRSQARTEEARESASRDMLTGLHNRVWIEKQIEHRMDSAIPFCIAIIDIDGFKQVNDEHGHLVGDELLKKFCAELQSANRATDVIGRWGGDEFILILDGSGSETPAQIDRLAIGVCKSYEVQSNTGPLKLTIDASIGLAEHVPGETIRTLLSRADMAMYARKAQSRVDDAEQNQPPSSVEAICQSRQNGASQQSGKIKSLVVEDDATNRKLLQTVLSQYGVCDVAADGREAVRAVRFARENHQRYDLVCMDLRMPQMDGQEAIREIRRQEAAAGVSKPAKIIVTTSHTRMEDITTALLGRCNAYLVKPIDIAKLRKELKALGLIN